MAADGVTYYAAGRRVTSFAGGGSDRCNDTGGVQHPLWGSPRAPHRKTSRLSTKTNTTQPDGLARCATNIARKPQMVLLRVGRRVAGTYIDVEYTLK